MRRLIKQITAWIPTALPFGVTEFEEWASDIIWTYSLPDNDSTRFMLATMILHSNSTESTKPKRYFGRSARKSGSNQVAAYIMDTLKAKQKAEATAQAEAEAAAKESLTTAV